MWAATSERRCQPSLLPRASTVAQNLALAGVARWAGIEWIAELRSRLGQRQILQQRGPSQYFNSLLGWINQQPIHVVAATTPREKIVITVYEPDPTRWEPDFKRRKT